MYSRECYLKHREGRIQKSLDYYYQHRDNSGFMHKRREADKRNYHKRKPHSNACIQIEKGIVITFN